MEEDKKQIENQKMNKLLEDLEICKRNVINKKDKAEIANEELKIAKNEFYKVYKEILEQVKELDEKEKKVFIRGMIKEIGNLDEDYERD